MRAMPLSILLILPFASPASAESDVVGCWRWYSDAGNLIFPSPLQPLIELTSVPATKELWYPRGALVWLDHHNDGRVGHPLGYWMRKDGKIFIESSGSHGLYGDRVELQESTPELLIGQWTDFTDVANDKQPPSKTVMMRREPCPPTK